MFFEKKIDQTWNVITVVEVEALLMFQNLIVLNAERYLKATHLIDANYLAVA